MVLSKKYYEQIGHIPKADDLYAARDILYILWFKGGELEKTQLFEELTKYHRKMRYNTWAEPTFDEYLLLLTYLEFAVVNNKFTTKQNESSQASRKFITLNADTQEFLSKNEWTKSQHLTQREVKFFRSRLVRYKTLLIFLEVTFCNQLITEWNYEKIINCAHTIKGRKSVLQPWIDQYNLTDDRDPRALLTWCLQTEIIERDEYLDTYYLIDKRSISYNDFLDSLKRNYTAVFDKVLRRAKIPDLRLAVCSDIHISNVDFEKALEVVENDNPSAIFMDRATSAREEVAKFGIKRKSFYYYYIKISIDDLTWQPTNRLI